MSDRAFSSPCSSPRGINRNCIGGHEGCETGKFLLSKEQHPMNILLVSCSRARVLQHSFSHKLAHGAWAHRVTVRASIHVTALKHCQNIGIGFGLTDLTPVLPCHQYKRTYSVEEAVFEYTIGTYCMYLNKIFNIRLMQ